MIYKAILWASRKEDLYKKALSSNPKTDCYYYQKTNSYALLNNDDNEIETIFYDINGKEQRITLKPHEIKWIR